MTSRTILCIDEFISSECGGVALDALALALGVFGAAALAVGRVDAAQAQTLAQPAAAAMGQGDVMVQMQPHAQAELIQSLRDLPGQDLSLAYARIHATFRLQLSAQDLSVARALVDYAVLTAAELARRNIALPAGAETPAEMLRLYELVL